MKSKILGIILCYISVSVFAGTFDGTWQTTLTCPTVSNNENTKGYLIKFPTEIVNGQMTGAYGVDGEPGSLTLKGKVTDTGEAAFEINGLVGDSEYALRKTSKGKDYWYRAIGRFTSSSGTGERLTGRTCNFNFIR